MPWICDDTREESMQMLNTAKAEIVMGHLEIKGIEMQNGVINEHGNSKSDFTNSISIASNLPITSFLVDVLCGCNNIVNMIYNFMLFLFCLKSLKLTNKSYLDEKYLILKI